MKIQRRTPVLGGLLLALSLTSCMLKDDLYDPAMPARRQAWDNRVPFMLTQAQAPDVAALWGQQPLCPVALPTTPRKTTPSFVPTQDEWETSWKRAPDAKTVCTGKGSKRACKQVAPSVVAQAKAGALIKPTRQNTDNSGRTTYRFIPGADQIYEVQVGVQSPTYVLGLFGEQLAGKVKVNSEYWAASMLEQGTGSQRRETVILGAKEPGTEAYTALQFLSGLNIWLKLVAVEQGGMMSVSWDLPPMPKGPETIPVAQRPPKINMERLHTQYSLEVEGKHTPPWMPTGAFDDGTRMYLYFAEPLTYTRAPGVFALDQQGKVNLTQSHMFISDSTEGTYLMVQGLWPALRLQDGSGLKVLLTRQNPQH